MNFIKKNIKYKILLITLVAITGLIGSFAFNYINTEKNSVLIKKSIYQQFPILEQTDKNIVRLREIINLWETAITTGEEDLLEDADDTATNVSKSYKEIIKLAPDTEKEITELQQLFTAYYNSARSITNKMLEGKIAPEKLKTQSQVMAANLKKYQQTLTKFRNKKYNEFESGLEMVDKSSHMILNITLLIAGVGLILMIIISYMVSKPISTGINQVKIAMEQLSKGDLTATCPSNSSDEIGSLAEYQNVCSQKMRYLIESIFTAVNRLTSHTHTLNTAITHTTENTSRTHSETEQLAAAINEMAATVQEVSRNTMEAESATLTANQEANNGMTIMKETASSINNLASDVESATNVVHALETNCDEIGTVIEVIGGIAEQTNLLALNAAIEAARAGEQGRGFAVVADEVRSLANRTQESTGEIQLTIKKIQEGVKNAVDIMQRGQTQALSSVEQANNATATLNAIHQAVATITNMNAQIASATKEQTCVADEINKNILSINDLANETATDASESLSTMNEVTTDVDDLSGLMQGFKI